MAKKPKKTSFMVNNAFTRGHALAAVAALTFEKAWRVVILPFSEAEGISDAQRRLYWMILTDLQNTEVNELAGRSKDEWHYSMKRRFLLPIFCRELRGFEVMVQVVKREQDESLRKEAGIFIINELSIARKLEDDPITGEKAEGKMIRIMREYIDLVMAYARNHGVQLRIDAWVFAEAMGRSHQDYRMAA